MINWGIEQLGISLGFNFFLFPKKVASGHANSSPRKSPPPPGPLVTAQFPLIDDANKGCYKLQVHTKKHKR